MATKASKVIAVAVLTASLSIGSVSSARADCTNGRPGLRAVLEELLQPILRRPRRGYFLVRSAAESEPRRGSSPAHASEAADHLEAMLLINQRHSGRPRLEMILGAEGNHTSLLHAYDPRAWDPRFVDPVGRNFLATRRWLRTRRSLPTSSEYRSVHARAAAGGVEGVQWPGTFRGNRIYIDIRLTPEELVQVQRNPYLHVRPSGQGSYTLEYPVAGLLSTEALRRLSTVDPALARRLREGPLPHAGDTSGIGRLNQQIMNALVEERFRWFRSERSRLGLLSTREKHNRFVALVSELYRDLIAIHPFENVNGRSTRLYVLYHLFEQEGYPPPLLRDIDEDITLSLGELTSRIQEGARLSLRVMDAVAHASTEGRSWRTVPEVLFPHLPADIPSSDFVAYARARLAQDRELQRAFTVDANQVEDRLIRDFRGLVSDR